MTRIKHWMRKGFWLDGFWITALSVLLALILYLIGLSFSIFDPLGSALENIHLSDGFFYAHNINRNPEPNEGVVIVDIADCDSRAEIAEIVNRISAANPKVLAVDIIFGPSSSMDKNHDSLLISAFRNSQAKIVLAKNGEIHSFFADDLPCLEGDVALENGVVRTFSTKGSFVGTIMEAAELTVPVRKNDLLIDYSTAITPIYTPYHAFKYEGLDGQIVILGDNSDLRDFHQIPAEIQGHNTVSGTTIYAQELYTLINGRHFWEFPKFLNTLLAFIFVWLFASLVCAPLKGHECKFDNLQMNVLQIVSAILLFGIAYFIFWWFNLNLSLVWVLIGFTIVGIATEFFVWIKSWKIWNPKKTNNEKA